MERKRKWSEFTISWVQRVALYETKARLFIVGSNNTQTQFRVLKVDRTEPTDLVVIDDKVEYTQQEIREMLTRIEGGNRQGKSSSSSGLNRTISAFGIVGFVRLLEGYYLVLITKRRKVAQIGNHVIYKIEDTSMIYIPSDVEKSSNDEAKYLKTFQNVDLSSNFYFSYSYDLSHDLEFNLSPCDPPLVNLSDGKTVWETSVGNSGKTKESKEKAIRTMPNFKFVWNEYLLKDNDLHPDWLIYIVHGFVSQTNISIYGRPLHLTLVARRSQKFAGTRFLKRGANSAGHVANEVETEQILHDSSISSFEQGRFTSFVQMRGSVPSHWSQDISKMVPKPPIGMDIVDPYYRTAGLHFNQLFSRYGSPVIILNLVKKKERKPQESVLSHEFINTIHHLNQFLPPQHQLEHIAFDMARVNKLKDANVMNRLSNIAQYCIKRTGIFMSWPSLKPDTVAGGHKLGDGRVLQTGIVRVNCVDCLDRTNTAQFALGKCALAWQLFSLGVLAKPVLEYETDTVRMLEELYEDHGDTLALQYGGSHLVHRIKTYRKIAPLSSHSRDIMQTLSRYYSNTFSDADKQNAINVFLGVYVPSHRRGLMPHVWDLHTDFYLHNGLPYERRDTGHSKPYTCWWDEKVALSLPRAAEEVFKGSPGTLLEVVSEKQRDERTDGFYEQYRPYELTVFTDTISFHMLHTEKDFMPNFTTEFSPFRVRHRPDKRREPQMGVNAKFPFVNPSLSGQASTSSASSSPSEADSDSSDDSDDDDFRYRSDSSDSRLSVSSYYSDLTRSFDTVLESSRAKYGHLSAALKREDNVLYQNYVNFGVISGEFGGRSNTRVPGTDVNAKATILQANKDTCFSVKLAKVSKESSDIYKEYIERGQRGPSQPTADQLKAYSRYISSGK